MRVDSSFTLRIGSGLLLAVLLSVVGYQVVRRLYSHGPKVLLTRAEDPSWLNSWIQAEPLSRQAQQEFIPRHQLAKALYARVSPMGAHVQSANLIPDLHVDPRLSGAFESDYLGKTFVVFKRQSFLL